MSEEGEGEAGVADQVSASVGEGVEPKPAELTSMDPTNLPSPSNPLLAIRLKELELELSKQQYQSQLLHVRTVDLETQRAIRLKELDLELKTKQFVHPSASDAPSVSMPVSPPANASTPSPVPAPRRALQVSKPEFDISRQIALVPLFRESEVDTYFTVFERIAAALKWPQTIWPLLLQCKLVGKAQEVCSALTLEQSMNYEVMKNAVLRAYELVPEAYRQKFRNHVKTPSQTFVEFARDKANLFEKWCTANKVVTFEQLKELMLLEEFKNCLPEKIVIYLNEQKVSALSEAAVFADEFVLTHKVVFPSTIKRNISDRVRSSKDSPTVPKNALSVLNVESRECFYCHEVGHLIATCPTLKRKAGKKTNTYKSVALAECPISSPEPETLDTTTESAFEPFIFGGVVAFSEADSETKSVRILRDTGASQSIILESVLPFSEKSSCGSSVLVQGIDLSVVKVPLHNVYLRSGIISGEVKLAVRAELPVKGVALILGNDLAGNKVFCLPEVIDVPDVHEDALQEEFPNVFNTCVVTRAQAQKLKDIVDLSKTFLCADSSAETEEKVDSVEVKMCALSSFDLPFGKNTLIEAQGADQTLCPCVAAAVELSVLPEYPVAYFFDDGVLMRKWSPRHVTDDWGTVFQVVVPKPFREQVLSVAHDHELAGHVGVRKTYDSLLKHFFWPSIKSDVSKFCKSCHACQLSGKPNQVFPRPH